MHVHDPLGFPVLGIRFDSILTTAVTGLLAFIAYFPETAKVLFGTLFLRV